MQIIMNLDNTGLDQAPNIGGQGEFINGFVDVLDRLVQVDGAHVFEHLAGLLERGLTHDGFAWYVDQDDSINVLLNLWCWVLFSELHQGNRAHTMSHQSQWLIDIIEPIVNYVLVQIIC